MVLWTENTRNKKFFHWKYADEINSSGYFIKHF